LYSNNIITRSSQKNQRMEPRISNLIEEEGYLKFTLVDCNMSIANALRRIIISDIPTFVFRTFPYSQNKAEITHNTTRFHNEIIKQRLSCVPIHIDDINFPYHDYVVEVDVKNDTDNIIYVTTKDFKIKNTSSGRYSDESAVRRIFPPSSLSGDYIEFARLQPRLSENIDGERLTFTCGLDIGRASEDGAYNVISTCAYECTPDQAKANEMWGEKEKAMRKEGKTAEEIDFEKRNWMLLEAKRFCIPNSYNFIIETVGVYENMEIVIKACEVMVSKCRKFLYDLENGNVPIIQSETTLKNGFDITLIGEDYTLGKVIEFYLYQEHFIADKTLSFCGFRKPHPHSIDSMIRVAFHNQVDKVGVSGYFQGACDSAITAFTKIVEQLGGKLSKLSKSSAPVAASAAAVASSVSKSSLKSNLKESKGASASSKGEGSAVASTSSKQKLSTKKSGEEE
jgi:DNA-directed RNA polymerase subunit L